MSIEDCVAAARLYWTTEEDLVLAVAIAGCESGWVNNAAGDPLSSFDPVAQEVYAPYACGGYLSWGLWQIFAGVHHQALYIATGSTNPCDWADWLNFPRNNANQAWRIQRTQGWTAWTCYNNEGYKAFINQARAALGLPPLYVPGAYTFPNPFDPALYYALAEVEPHPPGFPIVW